MDLEFRAWCKERSEMFYQNKDFKDLSLVNGIYKPVLNNFINNNFNWYKENFEIMQYINKKDKNGRKIFVGDYLAKDSYWSIQIEYDSGCFMIRDLDMVRRNNLCTNGHVYNFDFSDWEVIGNNYENPDMEV